MSEKPSINDIMAVFGEVIPGSDPAPSDNFFTLGGKSLAALEISVQIAERWDVSVDATDVIGAESLSALHRMCVETPSATTDIATEEA